MQQALILSTFTKNYSDNKNAFMLPNFLISNIEYSI